MHGDHSMGLYCKQIHVEISVVFENMILRRVKSLCIQTNYLTQFNRHNKKGLYSVT
jgi:hypothetical protein